MKSASPYSVYSGQHVGHQAHRILATVWPDSNDYLPNTEYSTETERVLTVLPTTNIAFTSSSRIEAPREELAVDGRWRLSTSRHSTSRHNTSLNNSK